MTCPFCGSPTRHRATCRRAWADRGRRRLRAAAVPLAAQWLELFGDDPGTISPTGASFFRALLAEVARLQRELAAARKPREKPAAG